MKRFLYTTIALMLLLTACAAPDTSEPESTEYVHKPYVSTITAAECFICGTEQRCLYWGEDNVGVLNLNTFELLHIEINRYESSELITTPAGVLQTNGISCGESSAHATTDPDRGYSHVQIQGELQSIDAAAIQSHLCQTCLDKINSMYFGDYPPMEYAIVNFTDKAIRPLVQNTTFFGSGNYAVDCEFKDGGEVNLLVFYCPPRFK